MSEMQNAIRTIITGIGEDPDREGLIATPERVERMYRELCAGYTMDLETVVHGAVFHEAGNSVVLVRDISFYSLCEHHMLPFYGKVHVAYLPDTCVIGLSKIPRIVEMFARRLQIQERMTREIADALQSVLSPKGLAVQVEGTHMCSVMRGVKNESAALVTQQFSGCYREDPVLRQEFLEQIRGPERA